MIKHLNFNGTIYPENGFSIPYPNRAVSYGDGFFETMRGFGLSIYFYENHLERIKKAFDILHFNTKIIEDPEYIKKEINRLLHKDKAYKPISIKIIFFRKQGGKYTPLCNEVEYLIEYHPLDSKLYPENETKADLGVCTDIRKPINKLGTIKSLNSGIYTLAGIENSEKGHYDSLILNVNNFICETISSNIFFCTEDTIITPSYKAGCILGTMRKTIIDIACKNGFVVVEQDEIDPEILITSDEIFTSNAIKGITSILSWENKRYYKEIAKKLRDILNNKVESEILTK